MHRLTLERLPTLHVEQPGSADWISPHVSLALSDRERKLRKKTESFGGSLSLDVLGQIKATLHCLFMRASESNGRCIIGFNSPSWGIYTVSFITQLRLDLGSNTLVADSCLLPLTRERLDILGQDIANLTLGGKMVVINTSDAEVHAWKQLFPIFVERCRTWSHKSTCEYVRISTVPLSTDIEQNPLCSCGEGQDLGVFSDVSEWKVLVPYVTRAAFSPLFAVPYMEAVGGALKGFTNTGRPQGQNESVVALLCAHCRKDAGEQKLLQCSRCQQIYYCSKVCQRADWKQHKKNCAVKG